MRAFILATVITATLVAPGCWVGRRGYGPQQPIAHHQRYDRSAQQAPRDHDRREDGDRRDDRRDDRREDGDRRDDRRGDRH